MQYAPDRPALVVEKLQKQTPYTKVTASFIREDMPTLLATTLACIEFKGSHTADRIVEKLKTVMNEYDILDTATSFTTDTGANVKCACTNRGLSPEWQPCVCHVLELALKPLPEQKEIRKTIEKNNKFAGHVNHSQLTREDLAEKQKVRAGIF